MTEYDKQKKKFILLNKLETIKKESRIKENIMHDISKNMCSIETANATKLFSEDNDFIIYINNVKNLIKLINEMNLIKKDLLSLLWSEHNIRMQIADV